MRVKQRIQEGTETELTSAGRVADSTPDYGRAALAAIPLTLLATAGLMLLRCLGRRAA